MPARWSFDTQFVKAVHTSLKQLRRDVELSRHPLTELAGVESRCQRNGWSGTSLGKAAALRCILEEALEALRAQDATAACLLNRRFWEGESVVRLARELSIAESTLYARQRQALHALARILWSMEGAAQKNAVTRTDRLTRNLPSPTYRRMVGRREILARLRSELADCAGPGLICLEGLGGLGKTTLAHRFASRAAGSGRFADIGWVTAQQQQFTVWRGIMGQTDAPAGLTIDSLLDSIALQLNYDHLRGRPLAKKKSSLRTLLRDAPYLIVVDDLEMDTDPHALASELWELANPTRFLFTSCHSLSDHPQVTCLTLKELAESESVQLIRFEGVEQGIKTITEADDITLRQIYEVTGGHPLAIKLVVGQVRSLPLDRALHKLREARGRRTEGLYRFIYQQSWELLSAAAQRVLLALASLPASGGYWEDLLVVVGLPEHRLEQAVQELTGMSLLNVSGVEKKWYAIHQLTATFLTSGVLRRWNSIDEASTGGQSAKPQ